MRNNDVGHNGNEREAVEQALLRNDDESSDHYTDDGLLAGRDHSSESSPRNKPSDAQHGHLAGELGDEPTRKPRKYKHPWYWVILDCCFKQDSRVLTKHDKLKRLPPRRRTYHAWRFEVLRPWEPQPPKNYYELVHKSNPWYDKPPSSTRRIFFLVAFAIFCFLCAFMPFLLNPSALAHRPTVMKVPEWFLPIWTNVVFLVFTHATNTIAVWFVYLTGGFLKHWKTLLPFFLMMCCEVIWPDILFSLRHIGLATMVCFLGWIFCTIAGCMFFWVMEYAGFLLIFYWLFVTYELVVLVWTWAINGVDY